MELVTAACRGGAEHGVPMTCFKHLLHPPKTIIHSAELLLFMHYFIWGASSGLRMDLVDMGVCHSFYEFWWTASKLVQVSWFTFYSLAVSMSFFYHHTMFCALIGCWSCHSIFHIVCLIEKWTFQSSLNLHDQILFYNTGLNILRKFGLGEFKWVRKVWKWLSNKCIKCEGFYRLKTPVI